MICDLMTFTDLTVLVAKLVIAYKIVEFLFAGIITIAVLIFVVAILVSCKQDKRGAK